MTKDQKIMAYTMLLDGATYQAIADRIGVSKQAVQQVFPCASVRAHRKDYIYPNLVKWMRDNRLNCSQAEQKLGLGRGSLSCILSGKTAPGKAVIDKILAGTGLTYEAAFTTAEREDGEGSVPA